MELSLNFISISYPPSNCNSAWWLSTLIPNKDEAQAIVEERRMKSSNEMKKKD
jgi:hypothetical protein